MKINFTMLCLTVITVVCAIFYKEGFGAAIVLWILYGIYKAIVLDDES